MPHAKSKSANNFAAMTFELAAGADGITTEAHLLPVGPFRSTDIRPEECEAWQLDAQIAARVIARAEARKNDTVIVYEHQDLHSKTNGQKVLAAGWIQNSYEWREGKGLYAVGITWTGDAKHELANKLIRYISTLFYYDAITGEVLEIVSVALTNTPGLDGLDPLAALARAALSRGELSDFLTTAGENEMAADEKQLAALTSERDGLNTKVAALTVDLDKSKTQVAALTAERDALATKVAAVDKEKADAALTADKDKHTELMAAALTDGRLVPAQKAWAEKQSLAALTEYLEATNPIAALTRQVDGKGVAGNHGLSDVELASCTKMGVSPEEFAKNKVKK